MSPREDGMVRDRDGSLVYPPAGSWRPPAAPVLAVAVEDAPHECRDGWTGPDAEPAPCPVCKPHLVDMLAARRARCRVCRQKMDPVLVELGHRAHPVCDPDEDA